MYFGAQSPSSASEKSGDYGNTLLCRLMSLLLYPDHTLPHSKPVQQTRTSEYECEEKHQKAKVTCVLQ